MRRSKQLNLLNDPRQHTKLWWIHKQHVYGGSMRYRKVARPFDSKKLVHTVFKARLGPAFWFTHRRREVDFILKKTAHKYNCTVKASAINNDHIHILFYTKKRGDFLKFLRFFGAEIGRSFKNWNLQFGNENPESLWQERPFTRLVSWGKRSLDTVLGYIKKNHKEALGFIKYTPRKHRITNFLLKWQYHLRSCQQIV